MGVFIGIVIILALCSIVGFIVSTDDDKKKENTLRLTEQAISRNCPLCAELIKAHATKCKHCGSDVESMETSNFSGYDFTEERYDQIVNLVHDRQDKEAIKLLKDWLSIEEVNATKMVDEYKRKKPALIRSMNNKEKFQVVFGIFLIIVIVLVVLVNTK